MINEERKRYYISLIKESSSLKDVCLKANISITTGNYDTLKRIIKEENIDISHFKRNVIGSKCVAKPIFYYLNKNITITAFKLKNKILKEGIKEYRCEKCKRTEWEGEKIPLELHHINGDKTDNRLENLQLLCPNCHTLTENFGGKNQKINIKEKTIKKNKINIFYDNILNDINDGLSINELCLKYDKTRRYMFYVLKKLNIDKNMIRDDKHKICKISEDDFERTKKLMKEHKNYTKVGKILGLSDNAISKRFRIKGYPHKIKELIEVLEKE